MTKAEELALRNRFAGKDDPEHSSWPPINSLAHHQSCATKNKVLFEETMLARHGFDLLRQTQDQQEEAEAPFKSFSSNPCCSKDCVQKAV
jgi:hypothetical protein